MSERAACSSIDTVHALNHSSFVPDRSIVLLICRPCWILVVPPLQVKDGDRVTYRTRVLSFNEVVSKFVDRGILRSTLFHWGC